MAAVMAMILLVSSVCAEIKKSLGALPINTASLIMDHLHVDPVYWKLKQEIGAVSFKALWAGQDAQEIQPICWSKREGASGHEV